MPKLWLMPTVGVLGGYLAGLLTGIAAERHLPQRFVEASPPQSASLTRDVTTPSDVHNTAEHTVADAAISRTAEADDRLESVENQLQALDRRLTALETSLAESPASPQTRSEGGTIIPSPATAAETQDVLVAAGVNPMVASDLLRQRSQQEMQRLELRDQASREGWLNSSRYLEELRRLEGNAADMRASIGDDAYDRFLFLTGQPNRVLITSVIDESPAQQAGIQAGDMVLEYGGSRVFFYPDLRTATQAGERGEYVEVRVQRNGEILALTLPRGPLGVRLDSNRIDPEANK